MLKKRHNSSLNPTQEEWKTINQKAVEESKRLTWQQLEDAKFKETWTKQIKVVADR